MAAQTPSLPPGFRFHPTDEELLLYYLKNRAASTPCPAPIIAEVDIYKFDPWELPEQAKFGDKEWYFFTPRDRKYPNGVRPNRAAASGYWKATGTDKPIVTSKGNENIGVKKALVFYKGKPPRGIKTNWIMHEYRLLDSKSKAALRPLKLRDSSMRLDDWVLCRIYQKSSHQAEDSAGAESPVSDLRVAEPESELKMHKSLSLSELLNEADFSLLSRLLEAPLEAEMPVFDNGSYAYANLSQPLMHQFPQTAPSAFAAEASLKRQRTADDQGSNLFNPPKKQSTNSWVYAISTFSLTGFVVGYPFSLQGQASVEAIQVKLFMEELKNTGMLDGMSYTYWNENYTSKCVEALLEPLNLHHVEAKTILDKFAAVGILQRKLKSGEIHVDE